MWTVNFQIFKLDLEKAKEPEIKLPTSAGSSKEQDLQKNIYFCFTDYVKDFDCVDHKKPGKLLKRWEYQTTSPASWETYMQGRKQQLELDMEQQTGFKGKEVRQDCILSPCLFNLYAEYIMRNAGLEEAQAGVKSAGRNSNKLRYADDTTLMAESEEELRSLLMKVKEEEWRGWLKAQHSEN